MDKKRKRCIEYHTEITESNDNEEGPQKKKRRHSEQPQTRTIQLLEDIHSRTKRLCSENKKMKSDIANMKRNQRKILKTQDRIVNRVDNRTQSFDVCFERCLLKPTLPGSYDECFHRDAIRNNMKKFVEAIDLSNGFLIDEMLEKETLTDNEADELRSELLKSNKARKLAMILSGNSKSKFLEFLKIIAKREFYPQIASILDASFKNKLKENERLTECIRCFIVDNVNVRHIVDHLFEHHMINQQDMYNVINGDQKCLQEIWGKIFHQIEDPVLGKMCCSILKEALRDHYHHIAEKITHQHVLRCVCRIALHAMSYPSGSEGEPSEISTTSPLIPVQKLDTCRWVFRETFSMIEFSKFNENSSADQLQFREDMSFARERMFETVSFGRLGRGTRGG